MFIDVDYSKKAQEAKLHLAKPNKQVIDIIHEKFGDSVSLKLGDINELTFSIPHQVVDEETGEMIKNKHVDMIRERMLIRLTLGAYKEWYIIDEIEEAGEDSDIFTVKAFSLGYELRSKKCPVFSSENVYNAREALERMLSETIWTIGEIDPIFEEMYRSFDTSENTNVLDAIMQAVETYGALIEWDTHNRKISFKDMKKVGRFRGMTVNYGRLLRSIRRIRTTDEMVTRLHIRGAEGLTIHSVNPTGQGYIEDFSFFMYPFERDENKNVIRSSYFMSDELCHAILNHKEALEKYSPSIMQLQSILSEKEAQLITEESKLRQLGLELENIIALLDVAKATDNQELIEQRTQEKMAKESEIQAQQIVVGTLKTEIARIIEDIEALQKEIETASGFTPELLDELNLYIIEKDWVDDRYIDPQELYEDGLKEFERLRQPKVVIDVTIDNLLNIVEEQYYWDKLVLGDRIKVKYPQMGIEYMATIIEINYDLENGEANLVIANTKELLDDMEKLIQLLYSNSSASTLIENNKYKWDKINAVEKEVNAIVSQEWDANQRRIIAGVNNSIEVGNRGILIKDPDFPEEMIIIQAGILALTEDGGETWKTAVKPSGVVAERLIGRIIAGQELIITNSAGSFTMDANGFRIRASEFVVQSSSGDKNLVEEWTKTGDFVEDFLDDNIITHYEKDQLQAQWDAYELQYNFIVQLLNGYFDDQGNSIPEIINLHQKYEELYTYLFIEEQTDGYPLLSLDSRDKATRIDRVIFEQRWNGYRNAVPPVQNIIQLRAKELAENANNIAEEAKKNIEEVMDDVVWKIELHSSHGTTFRNGNVRTTITAKVYRGKDDITKHLPKESFIWKKRDRYGVLDEEWNNKHIGVGNVIEIDEYDVYQKAVFSCDVDIPEGFEIPEE